MVLGICASQWAASLLTTSRGYNSTPQIQVCEKGVAHRGVWSGTLSLAWRPWSPSLIGSVPRDAQGRLTI